MDRLGWRGLGVWGQGQLLAGDRAEVMASLWGVVTSPGTSGQVLAAWLLFLHRGLAAVWPWTSMGPSFLGMLGLAGPLGLLGHPTPLPGTPTARILSFLRGCPEPCSTPRAGTPIPEGSLGSVGLPELWQPRFGGQGSSGDSGPLTPQILTPSCSDYTPSPWDPHSNDTPPEWGWAHQDPQDFNTSSLCLGPPKPCYLSL